MNGEESLRNRVLLGVGSARLKFPRLSSASGEFGEFGGV